LARRSTATFMLLLTIGTLAACGSDPPTLIPLAQVPVASPLAEPTARPTDAPDSAAGGSAMLLLSEPLEMPAFATPPMAPLPYPTAPPPGVRASEAELIFSPPVPSAAEIMEWRPPCVPVPHSLHPNDHYWFRRPIPSGTVDWGLDWYPYGGNGYGQWHTHHGMDMPNDPGTPVLAAGDGTVVWVTDNWFPVYVIAEETEEATDEQSESAQEQPQSEEETPPESDEETQAQEGEEADDAADQEPKKQVLGPYGNFVIIRHDWGWQGEPIYTLYGHLLEVFVEEGEHVRAGDLIAGVGNTGASSGPHLHFEVRLGEDDYNHTVNPALWLAPYEGWGTLAGRITTATGTFLYNATLTVFPAEPDSLLDASEPRVVTSYADDQVNPDRIWQENFVIPDLPAGEYRLTARAGGELLEARVTIRPGVTTFVKLHTSPTVAQSLTPTLSPTDTPSPD
jgi:murein DD-endopeptidase MepM/ murein hydrolase activator NlpD